MEFDKQSGGGLLPATFPEAMNEYRGADNLNEVFVPPVGPPDETGAPETAVLPEASPTIVPPRGFDANVAAVQEALGRAAYGALPTDGQVGTATREAVARFQADHGLAVTGEITDALVVELRALGMLPED
jgi:peptidoglycan hydrolase-like protein with peptidoglycan-binding domain